MSQDQSPPGGLVFLYLLAGWSDQYAFLISLPKQMDGIHQVPAKFTPRYPPQIVSGIPQENAATNKDLTHWNIDVSNAMSGAGIAFAIQAVHPAWLTKIKTQKQKKRLENASVRRTPRGSSRAHLRLLSFSC
ncbi:MAG: hypothetical protein QM760_06665 [Nibricoccus sp.]